MSTGPAWQQSADVVVIGTGVAGLTAALAADRAGRRVVVLSKAGAAGVTATSYAQGGIAVVMPGGDDSIQAHVADTLTAGAGLCDPAAVASITADGYRAVADLVGHGARFDEAAPGRWSLTREGGHHRRRIVHAGGDATGAEVQRVLGGASATLDVRPDHTVLRVLHDDAVTGVLVANADGLGVVSAPSVIVATGGLGHLYRATTNPACCTGDGIALALWAGVGVSDLEFVQFHPTMLFAGGAGGRRPLVTEAIRGEGATLVDRRGDPVIAGAHPMGDLAPRDVVAAAIDARLRATGDECVYLDARGVAGFGERFPTVADSCRDAGIDPVRQPIPVVPGAHYSCGGISTDVDGCTELPGLFAAGEVARTGMHGANRLASNSLLEGLVVGGRAGRAAANHSLHGPAPSAVLPQQLRGEALARNLLQSAMTGGASMVRDAEGLGRLAETLSAATVRDVVCRADLEDVALAVTARALQAAASARNESRGCHHRVDYPEAQTNPVNRITIRLTGDDMTASTEAPMAVCG